jgi:hypothetical protein
MSSNDPTRPVGNRETKEKEVLFRRQYSSEVAAHRALRDYVRPRLSKDNNVRVTLETVEAAVAKSATQPANSGQYAGSNPAGRNHSFSAVGK